MRKVNEEIKIFPYEDIINLPHHVSGQRSPMSLADRAAQFSPFAALTGYDGAIKETARLTDQKIELDETEKYILDEKLRLLQEQLSSRPEIELTFFSMDEKKDGGSYRSIVGSIAKIDRLNRCLIMQDGMQIAIDEILDISGELFQRMEDR